MATLTLPFFATRCFSVTDSRPFLIVSLQNNVIIITVGTQYALDRVQLNVAVLGVVVCYDVDVKESAW